MTNQSFYHAHDVITSRCDGRMKCLRICPTRAIRLRKGKVTLLEDLCIDCGECINVCPNHVFVPVIDEMADFGRFRYKVAIPSPVLYTQFGLEFHPALVQQALRNAGFDEVADISRTSHELDFVLQEHLRIHTETRPLISAFCPTVLRLIQVNYPNLVSFIEPFDVPREIVAKQIKLTYPGKLGLKPEEIGVVFITPCPAKTVSIKQPAEKEHSWVDGVISIKDIFGAIFPEILELQKESRAIDNEDFHYGICKGYGVSGHISRLLNPERCLSVTGLNNVKKIFDDLENSKLRNIDFIEALACLQGCVGGALCVENPYISRHNSILLERKYGHPRPMDEDTVLRRYHEGYYFLEHPILPRAKGPIVHDIATSIKRMRQKERILLKLPQKDCGLCGAPNCETFASDCAYSEADLTDCAFFSDKFKARG